MIEYTKYTEKYTEVGGMSKETGESLEDLVKLYYGETNVSGDEAHEVDELLKKVEKSGFLDKCREVARQKQKEREKKYVRIGHRWVSKVAILIIAVILISATGVTVYAAVQNHIQNIKVKGMGDHSEFEIMYNDASGSERKVGFLYYEPEWIPDGYYKGMEYRNETSYSIYYNTGGSDIEIYYSQDVPSVKHRYSTENGIAEQVSFGEYSGEYIETESENYLIVTDGTYIYSLIAQTKDIGKQELKKIIESKKQKDN